MKSTSVVIYRVHLQVWEAREAKVDAGTFHGLEADVSD